MKAGIRGRCVAALAVAAGLLLVSGACGKDGHRPPTQPAPIVQPPPVVEPTPVPPATPAPTLTVSKILAFGDSIVEGTDSPPLPFEVLSWTLPLSAGRSQSFPFKLKSLIDARYTGQTIAVYNGGLGGRQAREDRERFAQAVSEGQPGLILLLEGANDINGPLAENEGINARVTSVVDALEEMVREAQERRGIPVLIATQTPQRPGGPKAWGVDLLPRFNDALRTMAKKREAQVVDLAQLPMSFMGQDGLHPTESGYQRIAEMWFDAIQKRFEKAPQ